MDIKALFSNIVADGDVTLVSVYNLPNQTDSVAELFTCLAAENINVDMISLTPSLTTTSTVSFSAKDKDMTAVLKTIGKIKEEFTGIRTDVNAQNTIFTFEGEKIRNTAGVSAAVFSAFKKYEMQIKLITTSETSISCLIDSADFGKAEKMLNEIFGIKRV